MKKIILIILALSIIAAGVYFYLNQPSAHVKVDDLLPQGPLVYARFNHVEDNLTTLAGSPLWQTLAAINYDALAQSGGVPPQQMVMFNLLRNQAGNVLSSPVIKKLFGEEVALVFYPLDEEAGLSVSATPSWDAKAVEKLLSGLCLVTRVSGDVQFAEFISRFTAPLGANVSTSQLDYKGMTIHQVTVTELGLSFGIVRIEDFLVLGLGDSAARNSVDVFKNHRPSLAKSSDFLKSMALSDETSALQVYFDLNSFFDIVQKQLAPLVQSAAGAVAPEEVQRRMDEVFAQSSGLKAIGVNLAITPRVKIDARVLFDPAQLKADLASVYACPAQENLSSRFVPKDVVAYHWNNCFDLNYYWRQIKKDFDRFNPDQEAVVRDLEAKIGLNIEQDILPVFGDEFGGYLLDLDLSAGFPAPKIAIFAEIQDKGKAQLLIDKFSGQAAAMIQEESYNGVAIKYFEIPVLSAFQPGYCYLNNYLLVATHRQILKDSIDAASDPARSVSANPSFRKMILDSGTKSRMEQFIQIDAMISKIRGLIDLSNQWMQTQDRKTEAFRSGSEKPLEEVRAEIALKEGEMKELRSKMPALEDQIWNAESKGEDAGEFKAQLEAIKTEITSKQTEMDDAKDRQARLESVLNDQTRKGPDPAARKVYLDEFVYPILQSLDSVQYFGIKATSDDHSLTTSLIFQSKE